MSVITFSAQDLARQTELLSEAVQSFEAIIEDHANKDTDSHLDGFMSVIRAVAINVRKTQRSAMAGGDVDQDLLSTLVECLDETEVSARNAADVRGTIMRDHQLGIASGCSVAAWKLRNVLA